MKYITGVGSRDIPREVFGCNVLCNPREYAGENRSFDGLKDIIL